MEELKLTKEVTKTVFDTDKVKVGDILVIYNCEWIVTDVKENQIDLKDKYGNIDGITIQMIPKLKITKPESKLSHFKVGDTYLIENKLTCDRAYYIVTKIMEDKVKFLRMNTGNELIITEEGLDKYVMVKSKPKMELNKSESKEEDKKDNRPFFTNYQPHCYFKTDKTKDDCEKATEDFAKMLVDIISGEFDRKAWLIY